MALSPQLDTSSPEPLYQQLAAYLRRKIESRELTPGDRLPATRELAGQLGINRTTVSAAYELLEEDGFLSGQVGRGSFVADRVSVRGIDWNAMVRPMAVRPFSAAAARISFAASRPPEQLFPVEDFRRSCQEVLADRGLPSVLQLGSSAGYEPLRQYLIEQSRAEGVFGPDDDLLITNGCQQALDLIARTTLRPRMRVAVEDPVYPGLRSVLAEADVNMVPLAVGPQGVEPEALARSGAALAVLTPSFQNPTGISLPPARREAVLRAANQNGIALVENDIYGTLRYEGDSVPTIKELGARSQTVLLRSFSKIAFPGLRLGWVIGPRPLVAALRERKQLTDLHSDQFAQAVMLRFAESGRLEAHRQKMIEAGRERLRTALASAAEFLPAGTRWTQPEGGLNFWVTLPAGMDAALLLERAAREGVGYLPGNVFAVDGGHDSSLRLSFGALRPDQIREGISILGGIFTREQKELRRLEREPAPALV
jgi:2-aminoadipate transaminase